MTNLIGEATNEPLPPRYLVLVNRDENELLLLLT